MPEDDEKNVHLAQLDGRPGRIEPARDELFKDHVIRRSHDPWRLDLAPRRSWARELRGGESPYPQRV